MTFCGSWSVVKTQARTMRAATLPCRCWTCDECQPKRAAELRALGKRGKPTTFITLTVNPKWGDSPQHRAQELTRSFRKMREAARRTFKLKAFPFLAVFEQTAKGEPHLHILTRVRWLPQKWVANWMARRMLAPVVDIRRIDNAQKAAAYVAKYVGKDPSHFAGTKRYWRSNDYDSKEAQQAALPADALFDCYIFRDGLTQLAAALSRAGWYVWRHHNGLQGYWPLDGPPAKATTL